MIKKLFVSLAILLFTLAPTLNLMAESKTNADCDAGEVIVCFADGECQCKAPGNRQDSPEPQDACIDEDDDGACD